MEQALAGGTLIGLAAVWLRLSSGRIAGISGLLGQALSGRLLTPGLFLVGLGLGGWLARWGLTGAPLFIPARPSFEAPFTLSTLIVAGLLVGIGTRLGSGCTSGHGVCGIARLSPRSLAATATFMAIGLLTATLLGGVR